MREVNPELSIDKNNPIKIHAYESNCLDFPLHYHPREFELTLLIGAKGTRIAGDNLTEFHSPDLVLTGPGIPHCWLSHTRHEDNGSRTIQVIVVHFNRHVLGEELLKRPDFRPIRHLFSLSEHGVHFGEETTRQMMEKFMQLKLEPDFDTFLELLDIFDKLGKSQDYTLLCSESYRFKGRKEEIGKFESVFDYIQQNYLDKIMISDVARLIKMNDSAFSHYFKKRTGYSFTDFVNLLRLNHAAEQIVSHRKNIADICFESGFHNLSNFNRMFKKWKGETPLQYKKKQIKREMASSFT